MFDKSLTLYDSKGHPVAVARQDSLFAPDGTLIGLYLPPLRIFVDLKGDYLGEISFGNRLVARKQPVHARAAVTGRPLPRAAMGAEQRMTMRHSRVMLLPGFEDVPTERIAA